MWATVALAVIAAPGHAQGERTANPRDAKAAYIERMDVGWKGHVAVERWNPVTVWLGGGEKGFTGVLRVTFVQDGTQEASIVVPVPATPGVTVPVDLCAALPRGLESISLELIDQSGDLVDRAKAITTIPGRDELPLHLEVSEAGGPIITVGPCSLLRTDLSDRALRPPVRSRWDDPTGRSNEATSMEEAWLQLRALPIEPDRLPHSAIAYDGVSAVVIDAPELARMGSAAREALKEWLVSGGRVVVVASRVGSEWRMLLPEGEERDLVELVDAEAVELSGALRSELISTQQSLNLRREEGAERDAAFFRERVEEEEDGAASSPSGEAPDGTTKAEPQQEVSKEPDESSQATHAIVQPAERAAGRMVKPTTMGEACGWKTLWESDGGGAMIAEGPVGFGKLTIVGVDPERWSASLSRGASSAAWLEVMRDVAEQAVLRTKGIDSWYEAGSSSDESRALRASVNDLVGDRAPSPFVFVPVWGCAAILTLLIGPVDALLLKRLRARQRSWATALGWCALVSVAAAYIPTMFRAAPTTLDRIQAVDVKLPRAGTDSPLARVVGVTSVFGGRAASVELSGFAPGTWVHGFSASGGGGGGGRRVLPPFLTVQRTVSDDATQARTNRPERLWLGQWMVRSMLDAGPFQTALGGTFRRGDASEGSAWRITVWGLAPGKKVSSVEVDHQGDRRVLPTQTPAAISGEGKLTIELTAAMRADKEPARTNRNPRIEHGQLVAGRDPSILEDLPGARERSAVIDGLGVHPRWAVVRLVIEDEAGAPTLVPAVPGRKWSYVRICMPLTGEDTGAGT